MMLTLLVACGKLVGEIKQIGWATDAAAKIRTNTPRSDPRVSYFYVLLTERTLVLGDDLSRRSMAASTWKILEYFTESTL